MTDLAQWFEPLGPCRGCRKPATGILRGYGNNASMGAHCERCASKRIKAAHKLKKFEPDCCCKPTGAA